MIELKNIQVTFNPKTPLEQKLFSKFSLKIEEGEFLTVIGGNGAGKSTLMRLIAGDLFPEKGHVWIDGKEVTHANTMERSPWIARVFQDPLLGSCPTLTIEENLALAEMRGRCRGFKRALTTSRRNTYKAVLKELHIGLENRLGDPMGALSGGQRQAVSLLMATLLPAKNLLLDEHTAALDPKMAKKVLDLTETIVEKHSLTVLMITHSMQQALSYGNRTILLSHGEIKKDFSAKERKKIKADDLQVLFE